MLHFLLGTVAAYLPKAYRPRWAGGVDDLRAPAAASAVLEILLALFVLAAGFLIFMDRRASELTYMLLTTQKSTNQFGLAGARMFALVEYLFQPRSIGAIYFMFEGGVRFAAAVGTGEVMATLPLVIVEKVHGRLSAAQRERELGPRIADEVTVGVAPAFELEIKSCRPKVGWHSLMTIVHEDRFYELAEESLGPKPRQFVYKLRLKPENKMIRAMHKYSPEEPLREMQKTSRS